MKELVSRRLLHPISREAIIGAHIVPKEQCHFAPERRTVIHSASE
ncbi:T3SS effector NleG family protein [Salmonella enterica]|nr:T3SS effector NleG family protein [Salmonella enterica]EHX3573360.1 T3SS effector NleG family protein [Salmonella enterica]EIB6274317.1 T3SS effector NleG family protein [Salmonella enterica]EIC8062634.1 T3SS effector NleG family protein [Salmonella enterica]HCM1831308.1 T3SS effector NleG family protein [Salmonella enterica subsp. salamae serovar 48:z81:z39]